MMRANLGQVAGCESPRGSPRRSNPKSCYPKYVGDGVKQNDLLMIGLNLMDKTLAAVRGARLSSFNILDVDYRRQPVRQQHPRTHWHSVSCPISPVKTSIRLMLSFPEMVPLEWISCIGLSALDNGRFMCLGGCKRISKSDIASLLYRSGPINNIGLIGDS